MKKKPFVIDYQVVGTLHLSCRNSPAAALRARALIKAAVRDLHDISVYCEDEVALPIDVAERYPTAVRADPGKPTE